MNTIIPIILLIAFLLWALSKTTEKVLDIRQSERDAGRETSVYL